MSVVSSKRLSSLSPATSQSFKFLCPHLNYKKFRDNVTSIAENIRNRNVKNVDVHRVAQLYNEFCDITTEINSLRSKRNEIAKSNKNLSSSSSFSSKLSEELTSLQNQGRKLKELIHQKESRLVEIEQSLLQEAIHIPNDTHPDVPIGDESKARVLKQIGKQLMRESVNFPIEDHMTIAGKHDLIDLESAANVTGTSWYYLRNAGALLELALIQYAMQKAIYKGFTPIITPDAIRTEFSHACGFNPRSRENAQNYFLSTSTSNSASNFSSPQGLTLSATAEIPLAGIYAGKILLESQLPIKMVGFGRAFRAESGARGADTRGIYRVHQFSKVELFALTRPEDSEIVFDEIIALQEEIFNDLGLCFRLLDMPTEELGSNAFRKHDIEAWMPGRDSWGEISSASNCTDYQSRRLNIRYRPNSIASTTATSTEFVYTLNGTAVAVPRIIIAIMENFQTSDGKVIIPKVLRQWTGLETIG
ncbi:7053_t:CDS:2 [Ambispora gerdemannii]|uniref:serine--tRNA ligase n=1 Tax=Ambispora gerdemannii TaxID=144530 RepID=A0A9N8W8D0_9GLOM|nr:7053_t:CDS:2 [Ambispora gerdemannii]